MLEFRDG